MAVAEQHGEGPSSYRDFNVDSTQGGHLTTQSAHDFHGNTQGFQEAVNSRVVENM
jgi:hypothetical protein